MKTHVAQTILLIFTAVTLLFGQFEASFQIDSFRDDNLFRSPESSDDWYEDYEFNLGYRFGGQSLIMNYAGNFYRFNQFSESNFWQHRVGFDYTVNPFFNNETYFLFAGGHYTGRFNGPEYDFYDYNQLYGYVNVRFRFNTMFLKSGYNYRYRSYGAYENLSNHQHYAFAQINKSFPSRTSLIGEVDYGYKNFVGQEWYTFTSIDTLPNQHRGRGRGRHFVPSTYSETYTAPALRHMIFLFRVAQSIQPGLGVYVQYRKQINLTEDNGYANTELYYQDEELFDDPFSYSSDGGAAQITWLLPWNLNFRLNSSYEQKDYVSEQAYISASDTTGLGGPRADNRTEVYATLNRIFKLQRQWLKSLQLSLNVYYIQNVSNSYWYEYNNRIISAGIRFNLY